MLEKARKALRLTTHAYDEELADLIQAAKLDLGIAGVVLPDEPDELIQRAILTYVRMHFGKPDDYDRMAASYDAQKGALQIASGYTNWGEDA